jgi:hypothetical protein
MIWQMIKEAVEVHGNKTDNSVIRDYIVNKYPGVNINTILNQIIICTVNHESRVYYKENSNPRRCDDVYDFLFRPAPGKIEMYDTRLHGNWEICRDEKGVLIVREIKETIHQKKELSLVGNGYIEVDHLRAYLSKNLDIIEPDLELYVDIFGNDGVLYPTDFGPVDILATNKNGDFVVMKIKSEKIPDESSGVIMKFRNWVRRHLASGKPVRSYLIGSEINEHIRYSLADCTDVYLKEYDICINLKEIPKITDYNVPVNFMDPNGVEHIEIVTGESPQ